MICRTSIIALSCLFASSPASAISITSTETPMRLRAEIGFAAILNHKIQFGLDGDYFDYVAEGGQDNLFNFIRLTAEIPINKRHELVLLVQPLLLDTFVVLRAKRTFDRIEFPAGTPTRVLYDFGFWRASYLYHVVRRPKQQLSLGISLQLRNARIEFASENGALLSSNRGVGPVPIIKARWRHELARGWWQGAEVDGFYAPVSYLNGDNNDIVGAILDASYRYGRHLTKNGAAYLNLRYLGGGAEGVDDDDQRSEGDDGWTKNWLHTLSMTLGMQFAF
jgi:hypothetical protein